MTKMLAIAGIGLAILAGCATTSSGKPILTKRAYHRVLSACDALGRGKFFHRKHGLPYVSVKSRPAEIKAAGDQPTVTVDCVSRGLKPYRYEFLQLDDVDLSER